MVRMDLEDWKGSGNMHGINQFREHKLIVVHVYLQKLFQLNLNVVGHRALRNPAEVCPIKTLERNT